jgi:uracil-DNA glycosylase family 4
MTTRKELYNRTCVKAITCTRCPKVLKDEVFLNEHNGSLDADLFFIGQAPGTARAGSNPDFLIKSLHGNQAGRNFEMLLERTGINRNRIFVTNTVLHSPVDENRTGRRPSTQELKNCAIYLVEQLEIVMPKIIVTLGAVALESLNLIRAHSYTLNNSATLLKTWNDHLLYPMFHPSPQVIASWRNMDQQTEDYLRLIEICKQNNISNY